MSKIINITYRRYTIYSILLCKCQNINFNSYRQVIIQILVFNDFLFSTEKKLDIIVHVYLNKRIGINNIVQMYK